ncbi:hypothetical protein BKA67DRAFT_658693 [Truncatella angustata]|uniref:Uncharacterized protein n=1 Tax=Truncatella angustata TaxID=152316 RepID=A0A9P8ZXV7_9PEZI|nr:uncharacterized protein BKA67DRAFT_658693 [Truncatella angustata]KAH6654394.1 hypothetical protein BKA67DRAFT_658693 [Truncatella angustata]
MDEHAQAAGSPAPSPARPGRGGYRRGGFSGRGGARKTINRKPVVTKRGGNRGRGRGRNKTYDHPRVQSAYERSKELRDLYSDVSSAMKPALERLAEHTLNQMIEDPEFHKKVPEYAAIQNELDTRLETTLRRLDAEEILRLHIVAEKHQLEDEISHEKFTNGYDYKTDEFLDGILNRMSILAELRRDDYGTNIPASYTFVREDDAVAKDQGPYVFHHPAKGHEVPYPHLLPDIKTSALRTTLARKPQARAGPKRKAEDVLDGQPELKKFLGSSLGRDAGHDASTPRPRHIGGLLSAETDPDGEPESNAPSPTPLEEGMSPESSQQETVAKKEKDLPDFPTGTAEPDQCGVRTVYKRGPKANNRIIIPCVFEFDEDDIGFRDSTNDSTRKATKNSRGRFLNQPNSRAWHLDQTIVNYNVLDNKDGDLDPKLVKKHKVHPKYGFFLPDSINESEPPNENVDTTRPIVIVTPDGSTLHASRSVRPKLMDNALRADRGKAKIGVMVEKLRESLGLDIEDITTPEIRKKQQEEEERNALPSEPEDEEEILLVVPREEPVVIANDIRTQLKRQRGTAQLLRAATQLEEEEVIREASMPNPRATRPYDAVRDIFGFSGPPVSHTVHHHHPVDTFGLSFLADVSENPDAFRVPLGNVMADPSMIDPALRQGPPSHGFLQTALNPPPYASIAPAPLQSVDGREPIPARNPFTSQSTGRASPALPPLRPSGRDKGPGARASFAEGQLPYAPSPATLAAAPIRPQPLAPTQDYEHSHMLHGNGGGFYPGTTHRPFHHGYPTHEQPPIVPLAPRHGAPVPAPLIIPSQQSHPSQHLPYSTISPTTLSGQAPLAPMPPHMGPSPPAQSQAAIGPPLMAHSPTSSTPRSRGSVSSNNGQQNAGKYRKIAAAPIPYNRQWASNGGTELRLSNYDPKGAIKDYMANEPPPRTGPTTIRGWSVNNGQRSRNRAGSRKDDSVEDTESPK